MRIFLTPNQATLYEFLYQLAGSRRSDLKPFAYFRHTAYATIM